MKSEKLNLSLDPEVKESISRTALKKGMSKSAYITYLHEKDINEMLGLKVVNDMGILEEITKQMTETIIKHIQKTDKEE